RSPGAVPLRRGERTVGLDSWRALKRLAVDRAGFHKRYRARFVVTTRGRAVQRRGSHIAVACGWVPALELLRQVSAVPGPVGFVVVVPALDDRSESRDSVLPIDYSWRKGVQHAERLLDVGERSQVSARGAVAQPVWFDHAPRADVAVGRLGRGCRAVLLPADHWRIRSRRQPRVAKLRRLPFPRSEP